MSQFFGSVRSMNTLIPLEIFKGPFRIAVVGHQCGKSRLLCRFLFNEYKEEDDPTVEDFYTKSKYSVDEEECKLELLDTSGNDFYSNLYNKWFTASEAFIFTYSVTSAYSFDAIPHFIQEVTKIKKTTNFPMVLVGTQVDLSTKREVTSKEGASIAYKFKCPFLEVSSLTGENVDQVFQSIVKEIRRFKLEEHESLIEKEKLQKALHKKMKSAILPLKQLDADISGCLQIKAGKNGKWKKDWLALKNGIVYFYDGHKEFFENKSSKSFSLLTSTVKLSTTKDRPNCFELVCIDQSYFMETETKDEMTQWMTKIQEGVALMLNSVTSAKEKAQTGSNASKSPEQEWRLIQQVSSCNTFCADCNAPEPDWTSINLGVLVCIQCSGIHRSLGVHISKVRSLTLDKLDDEVYLFLKAVGNEKGNQLWEATASSNDKPKPTDERAKKEKWIRSKYVQKLFLPKQTVSDPVILKENLFQSIGTSLEKGMLYFSLGVQLDSVNQNGQTPLHIAAGSGNLLTCVFCVLNTNSIDARDSFSMTALDYCRENKHSQVEAWLLKRGAVSGPSKDESSIFNSLSDQFWIRPNDLQDLKRASLRVSKFPPPKEYQDFQQLLTSGKSPQEIAAFVYTNLGLKKKGMMSQLVSDTKLLHAFANQIDYADLSFDESLRQFLKPLNFSGDTKQFETVLDACPNVAYVLATCCILLSFNLHDNPYISIIDSPKRLEDSEFVKLLQGMNDGADFPASTLEDIYRSIKENKLEYESNAFKEFLTPKTKFGWLVKEGGKRKTWKKRWVVANSESIMYFKKQDKENKKQDAAGIIHLDSNLIIEPFTDSKKKNSFQIRAATGSLRASKGSSSSNHDTFLFAAPSADDMESWVDILRKILERNSFFSDFYSKVSPKCPLNKSSK